MGKRGAEGAGNQPGQGPKSIEYDPLVDNGLMNPTGGSREPKAQKHLLTNMGNGIAYQTGRHGKEISDDVEIKNEDKARLN